MSLVVPFSLRPAQPNSRSTPHFCGGCSPDRGGPLTFSGFLLFSLVSFISYLTLAIHSFASWGLNQRFDFPSQNTRLPFFHTSCWVLCLLFNSLRYYLTGRIFFFFIFPVLLWPVTLISFNQSPPLDSCEFLVKPFFVSY